MYVLFFSDDSICVTKDLYENFLDYLDTKFYITNILSQDGKSIQSYVSDVDDIPDVDFLNDGHMWSLVALCKDSDYISDFKLKYNY